MTEVLENQTFGALLRTLREKRAYSLRQMEKKAFLGKSLIERYEQGVAIPPSKQTIDCLVRALGCTDQEALTLESVWLINLLVSRGIEQQRANSMVFGSDKSLAYDDIDRVLWMAQEAIQHDAFEKALGWLEPIQNTYKSMEKVLPSLEYHLGEAKYGSGYLVQAANHFRQALLLVGYREPDSTIQRILSLCNLLVRQIWNRVRPIGISKSQTADHGINDEGKWRIVVDSCYRLSFIHYHNNDRQLAIYYSLKGLNIAEELPWVHISHAYQAHFFANMATATGFSGLHSVARMYIRNVVALEKSLEDPHIKYGIDLVLGVYFFGRARWEDCKARFERAASIAEEVGDLRHMRASEAFLASAYYWQGQTDQSFSLFDELYKKAKQSGDHQIMALAIYSKALHAFHQNRLGYALIFARFAETIASEKLQDYLIQIQVNGLLVTIYARLGEIEQACQHAKAIENLSILTATTAGALEGYYQLAEFYLWGWETTGVEEFKDSAKRAIKLMAKHARIFDVFRPLYLTYLGWYEFLSGRQNKAIKLVSRGIREAQLLNMSYHENLAQQCLTRIMG